MLRSLLTFLAWGFITGWLTYKDQEKRFTIEYPDTWVAKSVDGNMGFLAPLERDSANFQDNVSIATQDLSGHPMSAVEYMDFAMGIVTRDYNASAFSLEKKEIFGGLPAYGMQYLEDYQERKLKVRQYFFVRDKTVFILAYTAAATRFTKHERTASQIMHTFKFFK